MFRVKKYVSMVLITVMVICVFFATRIPVFAATCSNGTKTCTIIVKTKANYLLAGSESITIKQAKGICEKESRGITGKVKIKSSKEYGTWNIVAQASDHTVKKRLTGGSVKIKLKSNRTYKVTVSWDSGAAAFKVLDKGNYTEYPSWQVGSTWKVSEYY